MCNKYFISLILFFVTLAENDLPERMQHGKGWSQEPLNVTTTIVATPVTIQPTKSTISSTTTNSTMITTAESKKPLDPQRECQQYVCTI